MRLKYMEVTDVAVMFSVSPKTVYRWIKDKKIKAINCGSEKKPTYRILKDSVNKFEEKMTR